MLNSSSTATTTSPSDKNDNNNNNTDNNTTTMDDQSRAPANVWLYATRAADGKSATCNICTANIKTNRYSTTTLRSHLVTQHGKTELKLPSREIKEEYGRAFGDLSKPGISRLIHAIVPGGITPTESVSNDTDSNNDEDDDENDDENEDEDPYTDVENGNSILTDITMLIKNTDNQNEDENIEDEPQQEEEQDAELLHDDQSDIEDNDDYEITDNWEKNLIHDFSYQQSEEVDQKHIICVLK
ncbi:unnamed protein product, partial [Didymodactylos carnosus]